MKIINKDVKRFEKKKTYIFIADKIQAKDANKWVDFVNGQIVDVRMPDFGFIVMKRENKAPKEMMILPKFCYEVEL